MWPAVRQDVWRLVMGILGGTAGPDRRLQRLASLAQRLSGTSEPARRTGTRELRSGRAAIASWRKGRGHGGGAAYLVLEVWRSVHGSRGSLSTRGGFSTLGGGRIRLPCGSSRRAWTASCLGIGYGGDRECRGP